MASYPRATPVLITFGIVGLLLFVIVGFIVPAFSNDADTADESFAVPISKQRAAEAAVQFAEQAGFVPGHSADPLVMFQSDTSLSGYLQKNKLLDEYNRTYLKSYPLDYYQVELNYRNADERYLVNVDMLSADIIGWKKLYPYDGAIDQPSGSEADPEEARRFLASKGYEPRGLTLLGETDGILQFRADGYRIGDATLTLRVQAADHRILAFETAFDVPDEYLVWEEKQETSRMQMSLIALLSQLALAGGAIVMAVRYRGTVPFRRGLLITAVYVVTATINNINAYPAMKAVGLELGMTGPETVVGIMINHAYVFILGAVLYLSLVSGQAAWLAGGRDLWASWHERDYGEQIMSAMVKGYFICFLMLGVQQVIFLIGARYLDVWSTNDPEFSTYNIMIPALFPLVAWAAAIMEEAIFRLFAIVFFKKIFRSTLLAVLLSSMIWAIGHTGYPWYPAYTRFIEATILGFFFSWAYLRYGFATAVFAHAAFDSILMGLSIMFIGGTLNGIMGIFYLGFPALVAWVISAVHRALSRRRPRSDPLHPADA